MNAGQTPPSSAQPVTQPQAATPARKHVEVRAVTVVATLTGEIYEGPPPRWGSLSWGQRLARNVGLGTLAGVGAAYATGVGLVVLVGLGIGVAISAADKRA